MNAPILILEDKTNPIALKKWHFELTGDLATGLLLAQIIYWNSEALSGGSKLRVQRDGRWWIAKSRDEWHAEIGLSPKQMDRARDHLQAMGLIHCKLMKFSARPVVHISLNIPVLQKLFSNYIKSHGLLPKGKVPDFAQKAKSDFPQKVKSYTENTGTKTTAKNSNQSGSKTAPATTALEKDMANAAAQLEKFLAKHKPAKGFPDDMPIKSTTQLAVMWERLVPYYHDLAVMKPLTKKEIGMLGHFRKAVGDQHAYAIMKRVVQHWQNFLIDIGSETGDTLSSKSPQVGVLLKYWHVAKAFLGKKVLAKGEIKEHVK